MQETEIKEIKSTVEKLQVGKAAGLDTISVKLIKDNIDVLSLYLEISSIVQ